MNHGAIETIYKGYKFRSRLEARWAVFFDTAKIEWQYEPQGFEANNSMYLPDFYLPKSATWVEVKGTDNALNNDWPRMVDLLDWQSPIPGISDSFETCRGMAILGPIPEEFFGLVLHPIIQHRSGLHINWFSFGCEEEPIFMVPTRRDFLESMFGIPDIIYSADTTSIRLSAAAKCIKCTQAIGLVLEGYKAARTARFEHGRSGY